MKRLIAAFGVMGLVGCFVPMYYDYEGPDTWSWWQLRDVFPVEVYAVLAAYALAAWIGLRRGRMTRWHALAAALAFGAIIYVMWPPIPLFVLAGWWLMVASSYGGCAMSLAGALAGAPDEPDTAEPV